MPNPHDEEPEQVGVPLGEVAGPLRPRRQRLAGQDLGRRAGERAGGVLRHRRRRARQRRGDPRGQAHERELDDHEHPEVAGDGCVGGGAVRGGGSLHPPDQEPALRRAEQAQRDERRHLHEHEHAVGRAQLVPRADAERGVRVPGQGHDDEGDERDRRVPREHDRQPVTVELPAEQHDREQPAEPDRREHEVQPERRDRGVVTRGARRVALLRHRHEGRDGEHRHEHERRVVAHREAQHRDGGGDEGGGEPRLAEGDRRDELAELLAELGAEGERLAGDDEEREDAGGGAGDGEHGSGCRGDVEGEVELAALRRERPHREHERADHARRAQVHDELGDGEAVAGDGTRVLDGERRGAAAVREAREHRDERDGEEHGGAEHADGAEHRTSLDAAARVPARSDHRGPRALRHSPAPAATPPGSGPPPGVHARRPRRGARPLPHAPSEVSDTTYLAAALSFEPADTLTE